MNMNDIVAIYEKAASQSIEERKADESIDLVGVVQHLAEVSEVSQNFIVEAIGKKKYCTLREVLKLNIMTLAVGDGELELLLAESKLTSFADSFFFAMLGLLIDEEVI